MNLEQIKNKFINNLSPDYTNSDNFTDILAAFSTTVKPITDQGVALLNVLKLVKKAMDCESYSGDFDSLYDIVSDAIDIAENFNDEAFR